MPARADGNVWIIVRIADKAPGVARRSDPCTDNLGPGEPHIGNAGIAGTRHGLVFGDLKGESTVQCRDHETVVLCPARRRGEGFVEYVDATGAGLEVLGTVDECTEFQTPRKFLSNELRQVPDYAVGLGRTFDRVERTLRKGKAGVGKINVPKGRSRPGCAESLGRVPAITDGRNDVAVEKKALPDEDLRRNGLLGQTRTIRVDVLVTGPKDCLNRQIHPPNIVVGILGLG